MAKAQKRSYRRRRRSGLFSVRFRSSCEFVTLGDILAWGVVIVWHGGVVIVWLGGVVIVWRDGVVIVWLGGVWGILYITRAAAVLFNDLFMIRASPPSL